MAAAIEERTALVANRYTLMGLLGAGGMGQVYRAVDRLTGETVALKRVLTHAVQPTEEAALRLALTHEFQALAGLRHPNIISVRDYGFDATGQPYFTMELLYNPRPVVAAGQFLDPAAKVALLLPILHALAYIHRRGVIHRDLKPGNILVSGPTVKVLDFGLAAISGQQAPSSGTLRYMAPEVLRGEVATVAADLYAVGVIAYELLAGWHPFAPTGQPIAPELLLTLEPDWSYVEIEPPLLAVLQRLLAKDPAQRYPDAQAVIAALSAATGQALAVETVATRESFLQAAPFVGRAAELAQLTTALTHAVAGQSSTWLIAGESGVGKSRLLTELRTQALVQGVLVVRGQASSTGGGVYQIWQDLLRWLLLLAVPTALEAAVLKPVVYGIADLLGQPVDDAPPLEAKAAQTRLWSTIATLLHRAIAQQPLLLLLEDLHWADENSLELLQWLTRSVAQATEPATPLLIVGAYRRGEAPQLAERLPDSHVMRLHRLLAVDIEALSVAMLGRNGQRPQLVAFLQQETEGNTFFIVETLRALAEEAGQLDRVAAMTLPKQLLPSGVQEVVQRRLQRVPATDHLRLEWAAVAGRQLDLAVLHQVAPQPTLEQWLDRCANAYIVETQDGRWQFTHDKMREGILLTVDGATRRQRHQQLGQAIETIYADQLTPHYGTLAYHFEQAGEVTSACHYLGLAGEAAQAAYANNAAIEYYERFLALLATGTAAIDVLLRLGAVLQFVGRWAETETRYQQALALATAAGDPAIIARCALALGILQRSRGDFPGAHNWLRQAEAYFTELQDGWRLSEVLLEIGNVYYLQGEQKAGWVDLARGLAVARQAGNQAAVAAALHRMGSAHYSSGNYGEARTYAEQALALYEQLDNKVGMANALNNLGNIERSVGDYATAQARREATLRLRRAIGDTWGIAASLNNLAVIPYIQGDYATAHSYWQQSLALRNELGDRWGAGQTLDNLGLVAFSQGDYATARQQHEQSLALRREVGDRWGIAISLSNLAHAELYAQEMALAQQHYTESLELSLALDDKRGIISCAIGLAGVIVAQPAPTATLLLAVRLLAWAARLTGQIGAALEQDEKRLFDQVEKTLQQQLLPTAYAEAWASGQSSTDEALYAALLQKEQL